MSADLSDIVLGKSNDELPKSGLSAPLDPNNVDFNVPDALLKGTVLTKVSEKKQKQVVFHLDPDEGRIMYKSRKTGIGACFKIALFTNSHAPLIQFQSKQSKKFGLEQMPIIIANSSSFPKKLKAAGSLLYTSWRERTRRFICSLLPMTYSTCGTNLSTNFSQSAKD